MSRSTPLHHFVADKLISLNEKGTMRNTYSEQANTHTYMQRASGSTFYLPQEIVIVDNSIYDNLSAAAIKLLIQIQREMQINNPLWQCPSKDKSETRRALAQLKSKEILWQVGLTDMYIVNPEKIRRGKPLAALAALYKYSRDKWLQNKNWRVTEEDIAKFAVPEKITFIDFPHK